MSFILTKHHGLGNDFLVFLTDDVELAQDSEGWIERALAWCDRSFGLGADGLLIGLRDQDDVDLVMTLVNADGTFAEMSGNGIRCLAQAEALRRDVEAVVLTIQTDRGVRTVALGPDPEGDPLVSMASVDMGGANPGPTAEHQVEADAELLEAYDLEELALQPMKSTTVDLGNPHLVLLVDDVEVVDIVAAGELHQGPFPDGINVHVIEPTEGEVDALTLRVWERGVGPTQACGTGATAAAFAAHQWGLVGDAVTVHMPGGDVLVDVGLEMRLHGPTAFVAAVEIP